MKHYLILLILLLTLAACSSSATHETSTPAIEAPVGAEWPENFNFYRPIPDDPTGPSDYYSFKTTQ
jgi:hypothetical protein